LSGRNFLNQGAFISPEAARSISIHDLPPMARCFGIPFARRLRSGLFLRPPMG